MVILGLSGAVGHDPSAALLVDGRIVAAAEEERFNRIKHSKGLQPELSARWCLEFAGLQPSDVQVVAYPYAPIPLFGSPARWHYAVRHWYAPDRAATALFNGNRRYERNVRHVFEMLGHVGIDTARVRFMPLEHHLAHASSAFHCSGYERAAIMSVDGNGEYATTWFGYGDEHGLHKIKEWYLPDSLGGVYGAITEYLGFEMLDGEYKVMGMAPYGDPRKWDVSPCLRWGNGEFAVNTRLVNVVGLPRYKDEKGKGYFFSRKLVSMWGPPRQGDEIDEPYIHIAAATQKALEDAVLDLVRHHLGAKLAETRRLCFAGGVALNVKLNKALMREPNVGELFVQPAASDAGTALGAATLAATLLGDKVQPMQHAYLGPSYSNDQVRAALKNRNLVYEQPASITDTVAELLAQGHPVAWFQGRMEFGPRALGNRSILGNPAIPGIADRINAQIKYRERWRPFCPSLMDWAAPEILQSNHPSPYMTFTFDVAESWKGRIPEVVHVDGTARPQVVDERSNPRYYELLRKFYARTGVPVLLNTSLNRRGEPMICSPDDALAMFFGSDLQFLAMEDFLVRKSAQPA
jgi:carbamoyltransferase